MSLCGPLCPHSGNHEMNALKGVCDYKGPALHILGAMSSGLEREPQVVLSSGCTDREQIQITKDHSAIVHNNGAQRWVLSEWNGIITAPWIFREPTINPKTYQPAYKREQSVEKDGSASDTPEPSRRRDRGQSSCASSATIPASSKRSRRK